MPLSRAYDHKVLNLLFGGQALAALANLYIGLSTTAPAKDGTGVTEPVGGSYARVVYPNTLANWPAAVASAKSNATIVQFPEPTGLWGTVTHLVIFDVDGVLIAYEALAAPKILDSGSNVVFQIGALDVTIA